MLPLAVCLGTRQSCGQLSQLPPQARVSSIEDPRPRFSFQRASPCRYLACVYPSREQGPLGGRQPVHIYHK